MLKTLIIAEKPSLAKEIQNMLTESFGEKFRRQDGYVESDKYLIGWFFGHLLEALKPGEYDQKLEKWNSEDLPILPTELKYKYKTGKNGTKKQGKHLASLAKQADRLINACDPDREGEGIFRIWQEAERITKPVGRLWAPSLALKDLTKSWEKIQAAEHYDNLGAAQQLRAASDWIVGMNGTRAYTLAANTLLPIGRVKTATLALVVNRDLAVENYRESFTYSLCGRWHGIEFTYRDKEQRWKFEDRAILDKLVQEVGGELFRLTEATSEERKENPPKTFCMPTLQQAANRLFGWSLDKTLQLTQKLYEAKLVTYPRTDSPYLPAADKMKYYGLLNVLASPEEKALLKTPDQSVASIKNTDASHSAIIPTGEKAAGLGADEQKLYDLIRDRFVTAFMKPRVYQETSLEIRDGVGHMFRAKVTKTLDQGWKALARRQKGEDAPEKKELQGVAEVDDLDIEALKGAEAKVHAPFVKQTVSAKPKHYTPATLLMAMINVGKNIEDEELSDILKEVEGLGTAATRDKFPKELISNGYLEQKGRNLVSTVKGRELIRWVDEKLKSPVLTAEWEMKLRQVEAGSYSPDRYRRELDEFVRGIVLVDGNKGGDLQSAVQESSRLCLCGKCQGQVSRTKYGYRCGGCGRSVNESVSKKRVSPKDVKALFENGITGVIEGFSKKDGSAKFSAKLLFNEDDQLRFSFDRGVGMACPVCKKEVEIFPRGYKCKDNDQCGFILWDQFAGKRLTDSQLKAILTKGKTGIIKGFISKGKGKEYDARLVMRDGGKIEMEFPRR